MADQKSRKELLKEEDAFIHAAKEGASWLSGHRTPVILAVVLGSALLVGGFGFVEYTQAKSANASEAFLKGMRVKDAKMVAEGETADANATPPTFATKEERDNAAKAAFNSAVEDAPKSGVADLARFYVADYEAKAGNVDQALTAFEDLASRLSAKDNLYFLAVERAAYIKEQKGDIAGALAQWQKLTTKQASFYGDHALFEIARLHVAQGEPAKAREALLQLEKDYAESSLKNEAQELLAQVGGPLAPAAEDAKATP